MNSPYLSKRNNIFTAAIKDIEEEHINTAISKSFILAWHIFNTPFKNVLIRILEESEINALTNYINTNLYTALDLVHTPTLSDLDTGIVTHALAAIRQGNIDLHDRYLENLLDNDLIRKEFRSQIESEENENGENENGENENGENENGENENGENENNSSLQALSKMIEDKEKKQEAERQEEQRQEGVDLLKEFRLPRRAFEYLLGRLKRWILIVKTKQKLNIFSKIEDFLKKENDDVNTTNDTLEKNIKEIEELIINIKKLYSTILKGHDRQYDLLLDSKELDKFFKSIEYLFNVKNRNQKETYQQGLQYLKADLNNIIKIITQEGVKEKEEGEETGGHWLEI